MGDRCRVAVRRAQRAGRGAVSARRSAGPQTRGRGPGVRASVTTTIGGPPLAARTDASTKLRPPAASASSPGSARIHIVPPHTRPVFHARSSVSEYDRSDRPPPFRISRDARIASASTQPPPSVPAGRSFRSSVTTSRAPIVCGVLPCVRTTVATAWRPARRGQRRDLRVDRHTRIISPMGHRRRAARLDRRRGSRGASDLSMRVRLSAWSPMTRPRSVARIDAGKPTGWPCLPRYVGSTIGPVGPQAPITTPIVVLRTNGMSAGKTSTGSPSCLFEPALNRREHSPWMDRDCAQSARANPPML